MTEEKFLDGLVEKFVQLEKITKRPKELRSWAFLELGTNFIRDYLEETILRSGLVDLLPDGPIYVFTPDYGFRFVKNGSKFTNRWEGKDEFNGCGTVPDVVRHLAEIASDKTNPQREHPLNVLFYNTIAKMNFQGHIQLHPFHMPETTDLEVKDYGIIKLYKYQPMSI